MPHLHRGSCRLDKEINLLYRHLGTVANGCDRSVGPIIVLYARILSCRVRSLGNHSSSINPNERLSPGLPNSAITAAGRPAPGARFLGGLSTVGGLPGLICLIGLLALGCRGRAAYFT